MYIAVMLVVCWPIQHTDFFIPASGVPTMPITLNDEVTLTVVGTVPVSAEMLKTASALGSMARYVGLVIARRNHSSESASASAMADAEFCVNCVAAPNNWARVLPCPSALVNAECK